MNKKDLSIKIDPLKLKDAHFQEIFQRISTKLAHEFDEACKRLIKKHVPKYDTIQMIVEDPEIILTDIIVEQIKEAMAEYSIEYTTEMQSTRIEYHIVMYQGKEPIDREILYIETDVNKWNFDMANQIED